MQAATAERIRKLLVLALLLWGFPVPHPFNRRGHLTTLRRYNLWCDSEEDIPGFPSGFRI